ncbi:zinc-alpha-2-glycoprotein-like [Ascaphus truei]|uniref:zinc-alpha-2-glycoprotein-like n=1 Tax=Ascaphus truei TaxID=8439 RepID=UPI003F5A2EBA
MERLFLVLFTAWISRVHSGSYSLQYWFSCVFDPIDGIQQFAIAGYLNGKQIMSYDLDTHRAQPRAEWMENNAGLFVVQTQYGCELREDGSTGAHYVFGYNGRDYMMYDKETRAWKPLAKEAAAVTRTWNNDRMFAERLKNYLEQGCVGELETFVGYGKEALDRKVRPAVKVWSKESPGHTQLHCLAYGFYPRDADVTWTLESQEIQPMEAKQILPNPDGTYQIRVTVEVTPEDRQNYTCHVEHDSLPEMLHVLWDPPEAKRASTAIMIGLITVLLLVAAGGIFLHLCKESPVPIPDRDVV